MTEDCIFCNIAARTIGADIVYENDELMVVRDILPKAPVHLLVIPKEHLPSLNEVTPAHQAMLGNLILTAAEYAKKQGVAEEGYKLIFNVGKNGGQTVQHVHLHLIGGKQLGE